MKTKHIRISLPNKYFSLNQFSVLIVLSGLSVCDCNTANWGTTVSPPPPLPSPPLLSRVCFELSLSALELKTKKTNATAMFHMRLSKLRF